MRIAFVCLLTVLGAVISCGTEFELEVPCVTATTEACACPDGAAGMRTCQSTQRWTACVCGGESDAGTDVADDATDASGPDIGPGDIGPDDVAPDSDGPDVPPADVGEPDAGGPDTDQLDTDQPDTDQLDTGAPDVDEPDAPNPDGGEPDIGPPDTRPTNPCGGDSVLDLEPGTACGTCLSGVYRCTGTDTVECFEDGGPGARNSCGGCAALPDAVGNPCGYCGLGAWDCDGMDALKCDGHPFDSPTFTGQMREPEDFTHRGGVFRNVPWAAGYDAGITSAVESAPGPGGANVPASVTIEEATIVATDFWTTAGNGQRHFWLADANQTIEVFFSLDLLGSDPSQVPPFEVQVGQRVSMRITELGSFNSQPQVRAVDGSTWVLEGSELGVYVRETEDAITPAEVLDMVRVSGELTRLDCADCAGAKVFALAYGDGQTVAFETFDTTFEVGQCLTFVGPVQWDPRTERPTLRTDNYDWVQRVE